MLDTTNRSLWKFQTADGLSIHTGYATDARGLRLRAECGYTHVKMEGTANGGWLQISVAIRKLDTAEKIAALGKAVR